MKGLISVAILFLGLAQVAPAQEIPNILWGQWTIQRMLPTRSISCWGQAESDALIGTTLEYSRELFRWQNVVVRIPAVEVTQITAERFARVFSGAGKNSSQVDFEQLGIDQPQTVQVVVRHSSAQITGGTVEIPGDYVLVKDEKTILVTACGVWFEATRDSAARK